MSLSVAKELKILYYLSLLCIFLSSCVSEQWVRGYVQHELAGVKDIVAEEVYPLEKAIMDLKTQMASIIVELKEVSNELQVARKVALASNNPEGVEQKVARLEQDLKRLEGIIGKLQELHSGLVQIQTGFGELGQTGIETIGKEPEPTQGGTGITPGVASPPQEPR